MRVFSGERVWGECIHVASNTRVPEAAGSAPNRIGQRWPRRRAKQRHSQGEPGSKLACSLGLKQRGIILSVGLCARSWRPRTHKRPPLGGPGWPRTAARAWAGSPGTEVWVARSPPAPADFPPSQYKTHTYIHCVNTLFGHRSHRVNRSMRGEGELKMAAKPGRTADPAPPLHPAQGAQAWL